MQVLKIRFSSSPIFCKSYTLISTGISSCGFNPLASVILKVMLHNGSGSCCLQSLSFWSLPQNGLDNLLTNFLELKTSGSRMSSCTKAGRSVPVFSSLINSDSEVNEFIKHRHKRRLPSNLEPETPPPSYEDREKAAKAICNARFFAIGNSNNTYNIDLFKKGIAHCWFWETTAGPAGLCILPLS